MSNPQPPYGQQPPAPWSPYPGNAPAGGYPQQQGGYPQQGGYAPPSNYPAPEAYPPQQPGMYAQPSGYGQPQPPAGYAPNPYAPNPYAPVPAPSAPPAVRNNPLAGALAAIGGIAAIIGFVALPYYSITASSSLGSRSLHLSAHAFSKSKTSGGGGYTELYGVLAAAALVILIGGALATMSQSMAASQARSLAITTIIAGLAGVGILIRVFLDFSNQISKQTAGQSTAGFSYGFDFGFWLSIAGMALAVIGGAIAMSKAKN